MKNINLKEISTTEIANFIQKAVPFDNLDKNGGIYETNSLGIDSYGDNITIGVSYESENEEGCLKEYYYYNIFAGDNYIDLGEDCIGYSYDKIPLPTLNSIKDKICSLLN